MARIPDDRHSPAPTHVVDSLREKLADAIRPKPSAAPVAASPTAAPAKPPRKPSWHRLITDDVIATMRRRGDL
jgi:hypothetical protein